MFIKSFGEEGMLHETGRLPNLSCALGGPGRHAVHQGNEKWAGRDGASAANITETFRRAFVNRSEQMAGDAVRWLGFHSNRDAKIL